METDRRGFLKLLGLGGTGLLVGVNQRWSLFGSDDAPELIVPSGLVRHHVVYAPKNGSSGFLHAIRNPRFYRADNIAEEFAIEEGDFHTPFYKVCLRIREHFTQASMEMLTDLDPHTRQFANLVTVVDAPIWMMENGTWAPTAWAMTSYQQFIVLGDPQIGSEYESYSTNGEYPINVPDTLQMKILLALDKTYVTEGRLVSRREALGSKIHIASR